MLWTDEQESELRQRWAAGESARQIAAATGMSRNAILGKIHRLGLSVRVNRKPVHRVEHADKGRRRKAARAREQKIAARANQSPITNVILARARAMGELPACEAVELPQETISRPPVELLDLEPHHCRWPIDQDGTTMFCGADKHTGAYCARHALLAYRPFVCRKISDKEREIHRRVAFQNIREGKWRSQGCAHTLT